MASTFVLIIKDKNGLENTIGKVILSGLDQTINHSKAIAIQMAEKPSQETMAKSLHAEILPGEQGNAIDLALEILIRYEKNEELVLT